LSSTQGALRDDIGTTGPYVAEGEGFEPSVDQRPTTVFETRPVHAACGLPERISAPRIIVRARIRASGQAPKDFSPVEHLRLRALYLYRVYVVELSDDTGPRLDPRFAWLYVGQSVWTPEERFAQHREQVHSSPDVRRYGRRLRPELYLDLPAFEHRGEAEKAEDTRAARLGKPAVAQQRSPRACAMHIKQSIAEPRLLLTGASG